MYLHRRVSEDQKLFVMLECIVCCLRHKAFGSVRYCVAPLRDANKSELLFIFLRGLILSPAAREATRFSAHICFYCVQNPPQTCLRSLLWLASWKTVCARRSRVHADVTSAFIIHEEDQTLDEIWNINGTACVPREQLRNEESGEGLFSPDLCGTHTLNKHLLK